MSALTGAVRSDPCGLACLGAGTQWHSVTVAQCHSGTVAQCHSGTVAQCHSGTVSQWHSGTVSQWHSGTVSQAPHALHAAVDHLLARSPPPLYFVAHLPALLRPSYLAFRSNQAPPLALPLALPCPLVRIVRALAPVPADEAVLDACTAIAASLLILPPQPLSRPLTHAPIPALPSSLLALSPTTILLPSPPSPPLSLPLASACLTPAVLTSLWRLYLSPATPAPGTAAGKDTSANCYRHAHSATASAPLPAAAASHTAAPPSAGREDTGQCESRAHCSTDKSRALDCNTENATSRSSSSSPACQHRAPWEARRPAAVAAVLHVLQLLAHRWPPALSEITRELLPLQQWPLAGSQESAGGGGGATGGHTVERMWRMAQVVGMAAASGGHADDGAVAEAALSLLNVMAQDPSVCHMLLRPPLDLLPALARHLTPSPSSRSSSFSSPSCTSFSSPSSPSSSFSSPSCTSSPVPRAAKPPSPSCEHLRATRPSLLPAVMHLPPPLLLPLPLLRRPSNPSSPSPCEQPSHASPSLPATAPTLLRSASSHLPLSLPAQRAMTQQPAMWQQLAGRLQQVSCAGRAPIMTRPCCGRHACLHLR
ncbi:hypothetical protein CLOP_g11649 [Closterium sp. NIES-67]|nr:hypothetical protein CLOP_g11649 [Closterium sp. NIES-67]